MLLEQRQEPINKELEELALSVRHQVYKTMDNQQLPAKTDKHMVWLRGLKDIPINIETILNPIDDFNEIIPTQDYKPNRRDSGILESLFELISDARKDKKEVFSPKQVTNLRTQRKIRTKIKEYFEVTQETYMTDIIQNFQALIGLDDFNEDAFGNYQTLLKGFENEPDTKETVTLAGLKIPKYKIKRQKYLNDAILIGLSNIPSYIKENEVTDIQPDLTPSIATV